MQRLDLARIVGRWADQRGAAYDVKLDAGGLSCSVTTKRANGEEISTKALIRCAGGRITWGRNFELQDSQLGAAEIRWVSERRGEFVWFRKATSGKSDEVGAAGARPHKSTAGVGKAVQQSKWHIETGDNGSWQHSSGDSVPKARASQAEQTEHGGKACLMFCDPKVNSSKRAAAHESSTSWLAVAQSSQHGSQTELHDRPVGFSVSTCDAAVCEEPVGKAERNGCSGFSPLPRQNADPGEWLDNGIRAKGSSNVEEEETHCQAEARVSDNSRDAGELKSSAKYFAGEAEAEVSKDERDAENANPATKYSVGDRVHAWFYNDWFPATIRAISVEESRVQVLWDSEFSSSILPADHVAPMKSQTGEEHERPEESEEPEHEPPFHDGTAGPHLDGCSAREVTVEKDRENAFGPPPDYPAPPPPPPSRHPATPVNTDCVAKHVVANNNPAHVSHDDDSDLDVTCVKIVDKHLVSTAETSSPKSLSVEDIATSKTTKRRMTAAERRAEKASHTAAATATPSSPSSAQSLSTAERRRAAKQRFEDELLQLASVEKTSTEKTSIEPALEEQEAQECGKGKKKNVRAPAKVVAPKQKPRRKAKRTAVAEDSEQGGGDVRSQPVDKSSSDTCVLCERAVCNEDDEPDGAELQLCGKHLRELGLREQKLQKWAMQRCGIANALHSFFCEGAKDWHKEFCMDFDKTRMLIELVLLHDEEALDEEDEDGQTPVEMAIAFVMKSLKHLDPEEEELPVEFLMREAVGLFNVASLLCWHCREGRGEVMPDLEDFSNMLADTVDERLSGKRCPCCGRRLDCECKEDQ